LLRQHFPNLDLSAAELLPAEKAPKNKREKSGKAARKKKRQFIKMLP
jgi:hypothetical protein